MFDILLELYGHIFFIALVFITIFIASFSKTENTIFFLLIYFFGLYMINNIIIEEVISIPYKEEVSIFKKLVNSPTEVKLEFGKIFTNNSFSVSEKQFTRYSLICTYKVLNNQKCPLVGKNANKEIPLELYATIPKYNSCSCCDINMTKEINSVIVDKKITYSAMNYIVFLNSYCERMKKEKEEIERKKLDKENLLKNAKKIKEELLNN